ncbi:pyridoxal 5'-phosphate synthase [Streptomyces alfalfae]|uniref:Oxidase n=1 Tax=Streptomyces alfalfae TaxID=1642299 RepID=A0ABM6GW68_9ACTN|nr:pyridoxal 5'-phosphate synthase [Streptomyces alfalfae]AYA18154.1 pyridoxal 5'-phosphate synthase [Streptomyces fradiae]APY87727.1 oxidase [Streptomyces alfalfae]QUI32292.1 pyridoxal 5'-phosphate synthase [Streptomyces alfalfae]RXX40271.1 pyridoxal 5'-phosphate synthase [Streptomyces alfalfae]RZM87037.1 pyridoxal 5'-phosphate synthase [Streptomyces alfalfae]
MTTSEPGRVAPTAFQKLLRAQRVWDVELPVFDPARAPAAPLPLFHQWFAEAVAAGQTEPHTMGLATVTEDGGPDVRTVMLHDADGHGWHFASHASSAKGRQLAARPEAALHFYWPAQGRQIRIRGRVTSAPHAESLADLHARSTGALAAALVGHQSEVLDSYEELERSSDTAWARAQAEPDADSPTWTLYVLDPVEAEFFQGDARRRHVRLRYRRAAEREAWERELLWP